MENLKGNKTGILGENSIFSSENIDQLANTLGKSLQSFLQNKQEKFGEIKEKSEETITSHPFPCVATAFAVGVIIGLISRRN